MSWPPFWSGESGPSVTTLSSGALDVEAATGAAEDIGDADVDGVDAGDLLSGQAKAHAAAKLNGNALQRFETVWVHMFSPVRGSKCREAIVMRAHPPVNREEPAREIAVASARRALHDRAMNTPGHRYCIIGAGPSGLAQARAFSRRGIEYDVFERHRDVGGLWDMQNPGSPLYESAHFISSRTRSGFLGFPMPAAYPDYPRHDQILSYLRSFAEAYGLRESIQFGKAVERVTFSEDGARVEVDGHTREYAGVVCASGVNWEPNLPEYPGRFAGTFRHTASYQQPSELHGKRVLIIGLGNSGADIACDAARFAKKAYVSVRRGYHFIPKHIFGKPADVFAHEGPKLPKWLEAYVFGWLHRLIVGDTTALGMPKPEHGILESHPLMNDQLLHHLRHGDITLVPDVSGFSERHVTLADGRSLEVDEVLAATGYRVQLPYVDAAEIEWRGQRVAHYLTVFSRKHPALFTLGFVELNGALYPHLDQLAALVAEYARARVEQPEAAERFRELVRTDASDLGGGAHYVKSARHDFYCDDEVLRKETLRAFRRCGWKPPEAERLFPTRAVVPGAC